jgi:hypothetical protein
MTKSKDADRRKIRRMSNQELLDATLELAGGDWYDGDFTSHGRWKFTFMKKQLDKRLRKVGFLNVT